MKLKVCGMKYQDNIEQVAQLKPDYLGFIFYKKSSRYFDNEIPNISNGIKKVGVFVNESLEEVISKVKYYHLDLVQLHGDETPDYCETLKQSCYSALDAESNDQPIKIIKVFSIKDHFDFNILKPYEYFVDYYLFDTKGELPGGNGYAFNWEVLKHYPSTKPYFLSGGIGLGEVNQILLFLSKQESKYCHAIDVNSKFEIEPGLKNIELLEEFKERFLPA